MSLDDGNAVPLTPVVRIALKPVWIQVASIAKKALVRSHAPVKTRTGITFVIGFLIVDMAVG